MYFVFLTIFALLVGNRALKLNRNPWTWGIVAWLISPLGVWIVLEICGKKKEKLILETLEEEGEQEVLPLEEDQVACSELIEL